MNSPVVTLWLIMDCFLSVLELKTYTVVEIISEREALLCVKFVEKGRNSDNSSTGQK